jgi:O-antigen/teichoic acid export membrane protein
VLAGFALALPLMTTASILAAASQGFKEMNRRALALDALPPLMLCVIFVGLAGTAPARWAITVSFVTSQLISLLAAALFLRRFASFRRFPVVDPEPGLLSFSAPLMLTTLVAVLIRWGNVILLGALTNAQVAGLYQMASRASGVIAMVTASLMGIFAPVVSGFYAQKNPEQMHRYLRLVSRWSFSFAWPSFLFIYLYASQILSVLGEVFIPAGSALVLLALAEVFFSLSAGNAMLLIMTGHPRLNLLNIVFAFLVNLVGNLYWIPRLGAAGAALALVISLFLWAVLQTAQVWHLQRMFQLSGAHLKPLVAGILALVVSAGIREMVEPGKGVAALFIAFVTFGALYLGSLYLLRVDPEDREVLASLMGRLRGTG